MSPELVCSRVDDAEGKLVSVEIQRFEIAELVNLTGNQLEVTSEISVTDELSALEGELVWVSVALIRVPCRAVEGLTPLLGIPVLDFVALLGLSLNPLVHLYNSLEFDGLVQLNSEGVVCEGLVSGWISPDVYKFHIIQMV